MKKVIVYFFLLLVSCPIFSFWNWEIEVGYDQIIYKPTQSMSIQDRGFYFVEKEDLVFKGYGIAVKIGKTFPFHRLFSYQLLPFVTFFSHSPYSDMPVNFSLQDSSSFQIGIEQRLNMQSFSLWGKKMILFALVSLSYRQDKWYWKFDNEYLNIHMDFQQKNEGLQGGTGLGLGMLFTPIFYGGIKGMFQYGFLKSSLDNETFYTPSSMRSSGFFLSFFVGGKF